jgi:aryl-alcohol dehydrogenase-like predicted oxidoreductase
MEYRSLGSTGLTVSAIAFGGAPAGLTNYLSAYDPDDPAQADAVAAAVVRALELGITYFDTALGYGDGRSERIFGQGRRRAGALGQTMLLATKVPASKRAPEDVVASAEASLRNLGVDTVDVLQLHGGRWSDDEARRVLEEGTLEALQGLKQQGKARAIGFTAETGSPGTFALIRSGAFDVLQVAYSIIYQDACNLMVNAGPIVEAAERGMGVVTMRSLSSGVFQKLIVTAAPAVAGQVDLYALALGFVLSNPRVSSAIVGMRTAGEVEDNVRLVEAGAFRIDLEALHRRYVDG